MSNRGYYQPTVRDWLGYFAWQIATIILHSLALVTLYWVNHYFVGGDYASLLAPFFVVSWIVAIVFLQRWPGVFYGVLLGIAYEPILYHLSLTDRTTETGWPHFVLLAAIAAAAASVATASRKGRPTEDSVPPVLTRKVSVGHLL